MELMRNPVRGYAWGSPTAIPDLLGIPGDGTPQAELWLGAHGTSPSRLPRHAGEITLDDAVASDPESMLGRDVMSRFGPRLPFLLKVLAADQPLSLQVHPSQQQAAGGYQAEEAAGVPADAPQRRYCDPHHKPEMVLALTQFEALCGFRHPANTLKLLTGLDVSALGSWRRTLAGDDEEQALREAFVVALSGDLVDEALTKELAAACSRRLQAGSPYPLEDSTVVELADTYPGDPGVLLSLLLNRVTLEPGQAVYLGSGNVHAYLRGTALEVMASSDNVLRGGLTTKRVDVPELLRTIQFEATPVPYVVPVLADGLKTWCTSADEFELSLVEPCDTTVSVPAGGPRVALCLQGTTTLSVSGTDLFLQRGDSVFIPASDGELRVFGTGALAVAAVRQ